jgi:hypothetical protein
MPLWPLGFVVHFKQEADMAVYPAATITKTWNKESQTTNGAFNSPGYFDFRDTVTPGNPPVTSSGSGRYVITDTEEFNQIKALFYGEGTAGSATASIRIWGLSRAYAAGVAQDDYVGELLGQLTVTLGAGTGAASGTFASKKFVDTISVDTDSSNLPPGIRVSGDIAGMIASLMIDAVGYKYIIIEIKNVGFTGGGVGVVWRVL